jgi:hypothetical protein
MIPPVARGSRTRAMARLYTIVRIRDVRSMAGDPRYGGVCARHSQSLGWYARQSP